MIGIKERERITRSYIYIPKCNRKNHIFAICCFTSSHAILLSYLTEKICAARYVCTLFYVNVGYTPYKLCIKKSENGSKTVLRD